MKEPTSPTTGPWRIQGVSDAVRIFVGDGRKRVILARLCPPQISEHETWANARLMAAAPDLLAVLKYLLYCHDRQCCCGAKGAVPCPGIQGAREAIDKATKEVWVTQ
jgi:hypothetical protein